MIGLREEDIMEEERMITRITTKEKKEYDEYYRMKYHKIIKTFWILFIPVFSWESSWKYK